jgi:ribulose-phosphate 3-epimerase
MMQVVPAILPRDIDDLHTQMKRVAKYVTLVQVDVVDGKYAPEPTWPYNKKNSNSFEKIIDEEEGLPMWEELNVEVDLLVESPEKCIDKWIKVGISAAIIHFESTEKHALLIHTLQNAEVRIGLAYKPSTPNTAIAPFIGRVDFVQCMGSDKVGFHGVSLDERVYEKIIDLRKRYVDLPIAVDIGVTLETAPLLARAGVTKLVSGSTIFNSDNISETIEELRRSDIKNFEDE